MVSELRCNAGSGKTHTMEGPEEDRGVNYRTLAQLFQTVEACCQHTTFNISVSLLEVSHLDLEASERCVLVCLCVWTYVLIRSDSSILTNSVELSHAAVTAYISAVFLC